MPGIGKAAILAAAAAATVAALTATNSHATGPRSPATPNRQHWMPDVAERIASLRERTERADAEARSRSAGDARGGQWWREVAMMPPPEPRR